MNTDKQTPITYPALTALRGVGAIWVTLFHLFPASTFTPIMAGYLGVDLFFMMSGFIISHVHARDFPRYSLAQHWHFLQLRLARIYPLHVFILCLFVLTVAALPGFAERYPHPERLDQAHFWATLFLVHNWGFSDSSLWNGPSWSLSAEWLAYISFPLITILCQKKIDHRYCLPLANAILAAAVALILMSGHDNLAELGKVGLVRMFSEFTAGCLLWQYAAGARSNLGRKLLIPALMILAISWVFPALSWLAVFSFVLLVLSVVDEKSVATAVLKHPFLMLLGETSFSLYLCHWPLIQIYNWLGDKTQINHDALFVGLLVAIPCVTWFCWRFVEKPSRKALRKIIRPATVSADSNPIVKTMP